MVEIGFRTVERDSRAAGGVLGGGLAYRLFFWILALAVLSAGLLGFASAQDADVDRRARDLSMNAELARTIADAAGQAVNGRWWLVVTGIALVVWFAWSLLRALRLVQAAAWEVPPGRTFPHPVSLLGMLSVPLVLLGLSALTGLLRELFGPLSGIAAFVAGSAVLVLLLALAANHLPVPDGVGWTAHLPGAIAFVVALQGISLFGQLSLAGRLAEQEALYGALGLAATMLFALSLVSRGLVWAVMLNAVTWQVLRERRGPDPG